MVESKSAGVARTHETITHITTKSKDLGLNDLDMKDLTIALTKMPERNKLATVNQTVEVLFKAAAEKIHDDESKKVLQNLQKLVQTVQNDLLTTKPQYMDAFFFPN
jgi:hypothetical protein